MAVTIGYPPPYSSPTRGGGDEEGGSLALTSDEKRDAEVEIALTDSISLAMTRQTKGARDDVSNPSYPPF